MSDDSRDYIEEAQQEAQLRWGKELSPEELATKFAGHNLEARVFHMKSLKHSEGDLTLTQAANRMEYESALRNTHEILRRAGR
jgi:CMP-N-acetylneuraminic acid synthetase